MAILMLGDAGVEIFSLLVDRCSSMVVLRFGRSWTRDTRAPPLGGGRPRIPSAYLDFDFRFSMSIEGRRRRRALRAAALLVAVVLIYLFLLRLAF